MSNTFTIDNIRDEVRRKFAPTTVVLSDGSEVTLRNVLRLPKTERDIALDKCKELQSFENLMSEDLSLEEIDSILKVTTELLEVVADKPSELLVELDDDLLVTMNVVQKWMETSQPGEAEPSPNS